MVLQWTLISGCWCFNNPLAIPSSDDINLHITHHNPVITLPNFGIPRISHLQVHPARPCEPQLSRTSGGNGRSAPVLQVLPTQAPRCGLAVSPGRWRSNHPKKGDIWPTQPFKDVYMFFIYIDVFFIDLQMYRCFDHHLLMFLCDDYVIYRFIYDKDDLSIYRWFIWQSAFVSILIPLLSSGNPT